MKIKDLENAENLPMKESMRRSSDYDSWDCYHVCGRGYYSWLRGFVVKSVGQPFNDVYSKFKQSLSKKHVDSETKYELIQYFRGLIETRRYKSYWIADYYVDEDGILRKNEREHKNRDRIINYGEPEYRYFFDERYLYLEDILVKAFGWRKTWDFIHTCYSNSIPFNELPQEYNPDVRRFNNLCRENDIKESKYSWGHLSFRDIWVRWARYPYTETYKYRSPGYYRLHYEGKSLRRKYERERAKELIYKFNRLELDVNKRPILIN